MAFVRPMDQRRTANEDLPFVTFAWSRDVHYAKALLGSIHHFYPDRRIIVIAERDLGSRHIRQLRLFPNTEPNKGKAAWHGPEVFRFLESRCFEPGQATFERSYHRVGPVGGCCVQDVMVRRLSKSTINLAANALINSVVRTLPGSPEQPISLTTVEACTGEQGIDAVDVLTIVTQGCDTEVRPRWRTMLFGVDGANRVDRCVIPLRGTAALAFRKAARAIPRAWFRSLGFSCQNAVLARAVPAAFRGRPLSTCGDAAEMRTILHQVTRR